MDFHCCLIAILSCNLLCTQNAVWYICIFVIFNWFWKAQAPIFSFPGFLYDWKYEYFLKVWLWLLAPITFAYTFHNRLNTRIFCQTQYWWEEVMMDLVTECIEPSVCQTCRAMMWVQNFSISPRLESQIPFSFTDRRWRFPCQQRYKYIQHLRPRNQHIAQQQAVMIWCLCAWVILQLLSSANQSD